MSSGFWRRCGLVLAAAVCTSLLAAGPAAADPCEVNLLDSAEFRWDLRSVNAQIADGLHVPTGRSDAYDDFGDLFVSTDDGATYTEWVNTDDLGCTYEDDGREVAFPADTALAAGLEVRRKVFVPATGLAFARWIDSFTNTGAAPIALRMRWGGNLGSDGGTNVTGSSSGDFAIDSADRWAGTSGGDPDLAHVWDTTFPGADDVADFAGQFSLPDPAASLDVGNVVAEYRDVVVQPGETIAYMHADAMRLQPTDAVAAAETLGMEPDELDAGISAAEGAQIRNWNFGDRELDGLPNSADNCPFAANPDQADIDGDGHGDPCDDDIDGDGRPNELEGLFGTNPRSADTDGDGVRDVQDACPTVAGRGADGCRRYDELPGGASSNTTPLRVKLAGVRRSVARKAVLRRGLAFRARCNRPCSLRAELLGRVGAVRVARAGDLLLGDRRLSRKARTHKVRVKVTRPRLRRVLARRARVTLRVTAIDRAGNRRVARRVIRMR